MQPLIITDEMDIEPGQVTWQSPSNIAIVKYWGKHGNQLPLNPSISLTLEHAFTEMRCSFQQRDDDNDDRIRLRLFFHGQENESFSRRMSTYLESILQINPFLGQLELEIETGNSFPHSSGIASSASSMSALALCVCSIEDLLFGTLENSEAFTRKASYLARLASGSACRSIYGYAAEWGVCQSIAGSSDEYAIGLEEEIHPVFKNYHDDILIVSSSPKAVSSSAGHALMTGHAYAQARYKQAHERTEVLWNAIKGGDAETFGIIAEQEAMTLHALMMMSDPSYLLMEPVTMQLIKKIREFREDTQLPLYFTLDAGPNLHVLYPFDIMEEVQPFIESELIPECENGLFIRDNTGEGPEEL
jgi:diphosphomevalonate decarboxylase